jgi:IS605 OrfB family transposase
MPAGSEGVLTLTVKMTVSPEPAGQLTLLDFMKKSPEPSSKQALLDFMKRYREALNYSVRAIIAHKALTTDKAYKLLHHTLKEKYGLPTSCATACYAHALAIAKGWLKNPHKGDKPPVVKKLSMWLGTRCHSIKDGKVELAGGYKLRVIGWDKRYDRYPHRVAVLVYNEIGDRFTLHIVKQVPRPPTYQPRGVLAVDINEKQIVIGNTRGEIRRKTPTNRALYYKSLADRLKEKYSYKTNNAWHRTYNAWHRRSGIYKRVETFHKKASNITEDWARKVSRGIVLLAKHNQLAVAREDLTGLKYKLGRLTGSHGIAMFWLGYKKLERWLDWEAKKNGVPVVVVDPAGTSSTCPRCGTKLVEVGYRRRRCPHCGFEADRDTIAVLNIEKKALSKMGQGRGSSGPPRLPAR